MRFLGNKEKKELMTKLPKGFEIKKKDEIKCENEIIFKNGEKYLIIDNEKNLLPHLKSIPEKEYNSVFIDRGAIPFIIKGADLMRPGIRKIEEGIKKNDIIIVRDEEHNKPLALGFSLFDFEELKKQKTGKSIKIYHYFNDKKY